MIQMWAQNNWYVQIGPPAFAPTDIANLTLWLDADDLSTLTLDGSDNVSEWRDKSGNAKKATQSTVLSRPAYQLLVINSRPAVAFNGISHFMDGTAFTGTEPFSLFTVVQKLGSGTGGGAHHFNFNPGGSVFGLSVNTNDNTQQGGLIDMTAWRHDGTVIDVGTVVRQTVTKSNGVHVYYRNGGITFTNDVPATSGIQVTNYELGRHSGSAYANVRIAEAIFYSRLLDSTERAQVNTYLETKWGVV